MGWGCMASPKAESRSAAPFAIGESLLSFWIRAGGILSAIIQWDRVISMNKRVWFLGIAAALLLTVAACAPQMAGPWESGPAASQEQAVKADFFFCGARWGAAWEEIQRDTGLRGEPLNGDPSRIIIESADYMGFPVEAALLFDTKEGSETFGLNTIYLRYQEEDGQALLAAIEAVYGGKRDSYLDKNGVENPLGPGGWVSAETLEDVLNEDAIQQARERFRQGHTQISGGGLESLVDAYLRAPFVKLLMDVEENTLQFDGIPAVYAAYLQLEGAPQ